MPQRRAFDPLPMNAPQHGNTGRQGAMAAPGPGPESLPPRVANPPAPGPMPMSPMGQPAGPAPISMGARLPSSIQLPMQRSLTGGASIGPADAQQFTQPHQQAPSSMQGDDPSLAILGLLRQFGISGMDE